MNKALEGVITIVVRDQQLQLELTKDVGQDVDVLIAPDNPRWGVIIELLGERLQAGSIICTSQAEVNDLISNISKPGPRKELEVDVHVPQCVGLLYDLRVDLNTPDMYETLDRLSHISSIPFHHQLNQYPKRPGKQPRIPKRGHKFTGGFK